MIYTNPKVSIIILNWNGLEDSIECLESLKKITYPNYNIIVVDNGSSGNDANILEQKFSGYIQLIRNDKNYGFAEGNNIGISYALENSNSAYILLLNNDMIVDTLFLDELIKVSESEAKIGIAGPKTYFYNPPNCLNVVYGKIDMNKGQVTLVGCKQIDHGQYDDIHEIEGYLQGSCLLIKKNLIQEVGSFDESYFCYWEDTDYCLRVREAGYQIVYAPQAHVWHKQPIRLKPWYKTLGQHTQRSGTHYRRYYATRNSFRFMKKHGSYRQLLSFLLYFFAFRLWFTSGILLIYHRDPKQFTALFKGTFDGLKIIIN